MCEAGEDEAATTLAAMLLHTETGAITNFRYPYAGFSSPLPVDLARVDGVGVLVLERTYEAGVGNTIRLLLLPEAQLDDGTETLAPHLIHEFTPGVETLDNFEGLAARVEGETIRSSWSRTITQRQPEDVLYEFEPGSPPSLWRRRQHRRQHRHRRRRRRRRQHRRPRRRRRSHHRPRRRLPRDRSDRRDFRRLGRRRAALPRS